MEFIRMISRPGEDMESFKNVKIIEKSWKTKIYHISKMILWPNIKWDIPGYILMH